MTTLRLLCTSAVLFAMACGDDGSGATDAGVGDAAEDAASPDANVYPPLLRDTGLYSDFDNRVIASDVAEYQVAYSLWSDGATKQRWVYLPPGTTIDTTDMDFWVYPEGTKLWKEFSIDDTLVETRMIWKNGPSSADWVYLSYAWNIEGTEASEAPDGVVDALGTTLDIPSQRSCRKCHEHQPDFSLGFSAVQLAHQGAGLNLETLVTDARLTTNPDGSAPYYPVPGVGMEQEVLGYLHGNCGGCHHSKSELMDTTDLNMRLEVATLATVEETTTYSTLVGVAPRLNFTGGTALVEAGDPSASVVYLRMSLRDSLDQMPPRGTEIVDSAALATLSAWITSLTP